MLEGFINGLNSAEDALSDPALVQEFKRREYAIMMMADEYASFRRHLHALSVELWFTEDNIWTMNNEDGELSLSIMQPWLRTKVRRFNHKTLQIGLYQVHRAYKIQRTCRSC